MITVDKLQFYRKYDGDVDGLVRSCDSRTAGPIEEDWRLIERLRSGIWSIHNVRCAESYNEAVKKDIKEHTADEETRSLLFQIALKQK